MRTASPLVVRVSHQFDVAPERVFDAWLDAETACTFLFATSKGKMVRAEVEPRVGGAFTFIDRRESGDAEHFGEYLEIDRPRRLAFTFHTQRGSTDLSRVTVEIVPRGKGCELTLIHQIDPKWADYRDRTQAGWTAILQGLAGALG